MAAVLDQELTRRGEPQIGEGLRPPGSFELSDKYWQWRLSTYPEHATIHGYPGDHSSWTDMSTTAVEERKRWFVGFLEEVNALDEVSLNRDLLHYEISTRVEQNQFPNECLSLTSMGGPHTVAAQMFALMPHARPSDLDHILARLRAYPTYLEQSQGLLQRGLDSGVTQPKIVLRGVPEQIRAQIQTDSDSIPIVQALGDASEKFKEEVAAVYLKYVVPAFERFESFVTDEYLPKAREAVGLSDLPNGSDWYATQVRYYTTSDMSPQDVHDIGLAEVSRIRGLMQQIVDDEGFSSFDEFTKFLREDPRFYFETADELLIAYRDICKRADPELARLFGRLPRLPYGVLPVPSYIEKTTTTAYYQRGAPEVGRAGYFYANTYNLKARPKWEMEALSLHEAVPGHHLQLALAAELEDLPAFRKHFILTAYTEGWGLYAESLGTEMGFYKDPYSRFGQLTYEIWRAIRLVVDTGMHALGWSRDRAIQYFIENSGKTQHDIVVEIDRYIAWPGQALAYKIGELKIKELRARAEKELGEAFDIRAFHDQVIGEGALPLSVLDSKITRWIGKAG